VPLCCCALALSCALSTSLIIACECALMSISSICCVCPPCGCILWCCEIAVSIFFITVLASSYLILLLLSLACECALWSCCCCASLLSIATCCVITSSILCWVGYVAAVLAVVFTPIFIVCCTITACIITITACIIAYITSILTSLLWIPLSAIVGTVAVPVLCVLQLLGGVIEEILSFFVLGMWPSFYFESAFCPILLLSPCVCTVLPYFTPLLLVGFDLFFVLWAVSFSGSLPFIFTIIPSSIAVIINIILSPTLLILVSTTPIFALLCAFFHPIYLLLLGAVGIVALPCTVCACWFALYESVSAFLPIIYPVTGILAIIFGLIQFGFSFVVIGLVSAWPGLVMNAILIIAYLFTSILCLPITLICLPVWAIVFNILVTLEFVFIAGLFPIVPVFISGIVALIVGLIWYLTVLVFTLPFISTAVIWIPLVSSSVFACICACILTIISLCCACVQTNICLLPCYWVLSIVCGICTAIVASPFLPFIVCGIISAGLLAYTGTFFVVVLFTMMLDAVFLLVVLAIDILMVLMVPLGALIISAVVFMFAFLPIYLVAYTIVPPMAMVFLMASVTIACTYPPMTWLCVIPSTGCVLPCVAVFAFQIVIYSSILTAVLIPFICSLTWAMQNPIMCATCCDAITIVACATLSPGLLAMACMSLPAVCGSVALSGVGIAGVAVGSAFYIITQSVCGSSGCIPNVGGLLSMVLGDVLVKPAINLVSSIIAQAFTAISGIISTCIGDIDSYIGTIGSHWCGIGTISDSIATLIRAAGSAVDVVGEVTKLGGV